MSGKDIEGSDVTEPDVVTDLGTDEARKLTDEIRADAEALWDKIATAYTRRAWVALGYSSWDKYCIREFGSSRLRLPREERPQMVASLRQSGLSIRAIASATGVNRETIRQEIASGDKKLSPDDEVDEDALAEEFIAAFDELHAAQAQIVGTDGKTYPTKPKRKPPKPQREPSPEYVAARKARDEAEAALTPQERARRDKEAEAFAREVGDQIIASFSGVIVNNVIECLEELGGDIRKLVERGGVTSEQLRGIEAAHASYATELDVLRMSERGPGAST